MSKVNHDDFSSVKSSGIIWEPKQTGNKKEGNLTFLEPSDKSYIVGYYVGSDEGVGPKKDSTVHKIELVTCGSKKHLISDEPIEEIEEGDEVSVWGTGVLNDMVSKSVSPGQLIKIVWLGKQDPKNAGGNPYHTWDVLVNNNVEPKQVSGNLKKEAQLSESTKIDQSSDLDDDDDLPF